MEAKDGGDTEEGGFKDSHKAQSLVFCVVAVLCVVLCSIAL
jgi:hypothetical protein